MVEAQHAFSLPAASRLLAYRLAIPIAALCLYVTLVALWGSGAHSLYFGALHLLGVEPLSAPFLDIDAVLAAAECARQGVDVYLSNPCDALGRPHVYSPLWLALTPGSLGSRATGWVGLSLDLLFILSWMTVLRPHNPRELLVLGLAAFSPMSVYALERANNDLVVFLLILCAAMLFTGPRRYRLWSYMLWLIAGLLKYYPLILLIFLARERRRDKFVTMIALGSALMLFGVCFYQGFGKALVNLPTASYFTDDFSAENLPFGLAEALAGGFSRTLIGVSLLGVFVAVAAARTQRTVRLLDRQELDWKATEIQWLAIGGLLVTACFFAGQNVNYRGIYFLLVVPGLVRLHRSANATAVRHLWARMIAAVLFLMWEEFFRRALHAVAAPGTSSGLGSRAEIFFWLSRELVWWWLIAGLAATVLCALRHMPALRDNDVRSRSRRIVFGI